LILLRFFGFFSVIFNFLINKRGLNTVGQLMPLEKWLRSQKEVQ